MKRHKDKDQEKIIRCVGNVWVLVGGFGRVKVCLEGEMVGWGWEGGRVGGVGGLLGVVWTKLCAGVAETAFTQVGVHNCIVL